MYYFGLGDDMVAIGASSMDGKTASLLPKKQQQKRIVPVRLKWQEKDKALAAFRSSIAGNKEPEKSSGEEYESDLLKVDIKPEIYAQTVYSTSQHPIGEALGR